MTTSLSHAHVAVDKHNLLLVRDKLAQTLDMLDYNGVSGVVTVCLFPDGASYFTSGGTCVDLHGATMGLYAGLTAIRDLAAERGDGALLATINQAVHALAPVLRVQDNSDMH